MLKSILVPIDDTEPSQAALTLAIDICEGLGSKIEGLGLLKRPMIAVPTSTLGGDYIYEEDKRQSEHLKEIRECSDALLAQAKKRCSKEDVEFSISEIQGPAQQAMELASENNDLIIVGRSTSFDLGDKREPSDAVSHLARNGRRPLIITPSVLPEGRKIIVGYDGSRSAARTIQMLTLLGLFEGMHAEVISVDTKQETANELAIRGGALLVRHGISVDPVGVESHASPAEILLQRTGDAGILVIGAFGHRSIKEFIFGSCTSKVLEASSVPVFLYH